MISWLQFSFQYLDPNHPPPKKEEEGPSCKNPGWIGDGYCDDQTNTKACKWDGGDCCKEIVKKDYCTECKCKNEKS